MMKFYEICILMVLLSAVCGCVTPTANMWTITDIELTEGFGFEDPPPCTEVDRMTGPANSPNGNDDFNGLIMWQLPARPSQPKNGDWMESSSDYTGYLMNQPGAKAYRCATARVTVQRNQNVNPNITVSPGQFIQLYVVAPHLCNEFNAQLHPDEDGKQALVYAAEITQVNQTSVTFDQVIVASACGIGPYTNNNGESAELELGRWPSPDTDGPLIQQGPTNTRCYRFDIGFNNFSDCP